MNAYPRLAEPPARDADTPIALYGQQLVLYVLQVDATAALSDLQTEQAYAASIGILTAAQWAPNVLARLNRAHDLLASELRRRQAQARTPTPTTAAAPSDRPAGPAGGRLVALEPAPRTGPHGPNGTALADRIEF